MGHRHLNCQVQEWQAEVFEVVMVANMCHISDWESTPGLCKGVCLPEC